MTRPTRRTVLAGMGATLAALAGCSALPFDDSDERPEYDRDDLAEAVGDAADLVAPDAFPVTLARDLQDTHRERASDLLDEVPASPEFPNGAVAAELADERTAAADALAAAASGRPIKRLDTWRDRRSQAAEVWGAYHAAEGEVDDETVARWRDEVRARIHDFEGAWRYRGADPVAATVVHATLEEYVADARRGLVPRQQFPADPVADPFAAGTVTGRLEDAGATAVDAARIAATYRDQQPDGEGRSQRSRLAAASRRLQISLAVTADGLEPVLEDGVEALGEDPWDTPGGYAVRATARMAESLREEGRQADRDGRHASAVLAAGRGLVAVEALRAIVQAVDDGRRTDPATVDDVRESRERAVESLETAWEAEPQSLAVALADAAAGTLRSAASYTAEGYTGPQRADGEFLAAELMGQAVPEATAFVADAVRSAGE